MANKEALYRESNPPPKEEVMKYFEEGNWVESRWFDNNGGFYLKSVWSKIRFNLAKDRGGGTPTIRCRMGWVDTWNELDLPCERICNLYVNLSKRFHRDKKKTVQEIYKYIKEKEQK
jgi:hypothetical protein